MFLPLFPLELVVFPGEHVPLKIFEPRYKQLIGECREEGITFGIPPVIEGNPARYGTEIALTKVLRTYESGELDILTQGIQVFRLETFVMEVPDKLYSGGNVEFIENNPHCEEELRNEVVSLFHELQAILKGELRVNTEQPENLSFLIAHHVGLGIPEKVRLLSFSREFDRMTYLREHLVAALPKIKEAVKTRKKIGGNGHMKNFPKPD